MKIFEQFKNLDQAKSTLPLLVFDIETVRCVDILPESGPLFDAWKYQRRKEEELTYEQLALSFSTSAPLYAPFTKVVAASFGYFKGGEVFIKSFSGLDEKELLIQLSAFLETESVKENFFLGGQNIKGFDIPTLNKRLLANGLEIPSILDVAGEKPWMIPHFDLNEILRMGGYYQESLITACLLLGVQSSKTDAIDGSKISNVFYEKDENLEQISEYCANDVFATINCFLKLLRWDFVESYKIK